MAYDKGLADRVRSLLQSRQGFSELNMFGGICFMLNGNMCCGVLKTDLMLRLTDDEAERALRQPHTRPMDFTRKPMKSMLYVDQHGCDTDESLAEWVNAAAAHAAAKPPKVKKPPKAKAASKRSA